MTSQNLKSIEEKCHFQYPDIYKTLLSDNMLDWGVMSPGWYKREYPKLKEKPPLLLYGTDFEIIDFERITEEIESFSDEEDYRQTKKELYNKFIPFAKTGAGDLYSFYLDKDNKVGSIVLVWHDCNEVEILADSLENFIFRSLLECLIDPYEEGLIMNGDFKENINNQLSTHQKYLTEAQLSIINSIYSRDAQTLLEHKEFNEILAKGGFVVRSFEYQED